MKSNFKRKLDFKYFNWIAFLVWALIMNALLYGSIVRMNVVTVSLMIFISGYMAIGPFNKREYNDYERGSQND
jgi:hypothetical protein